MTRAVFPPVSQLCDSAGVSPLVWRCARYDYPVRIDQLRQRSLLDEIAPVEQDRSSGQRTDGRKIIDVEEIRRRYLASRAKRAPPSPFKYRGPVDISGGPSVDSIGSSTSAVTDGAAAEMRRLPLRSSSRCRSWVRWSAVPPTRSSGSRAPSSTASASVPRGASRACMPRRASHPG